MPTLRMSKAVTLRAHVSPPKSRCVCNVAPGLGQVPERTMAAVTADGAVWNAAFDRLLRWVFADGTRRRRLAPCHPATLTACLRFEGVSATLLDPLDHAPSPRARSDRTALPPASARLPTALSPPGCWCSVVLCRRRGNPCGRTTTQHAAGYRANRSRAACHVASRRVHDDVCARSSGGQALRAARS
jgi:hypothetical protein